MLFRWSFGNFDRDGDRPVAAWVGVVDAIEVVKKADRVGNRNQVSGERANAADKANRAGKNPMARGTGYNRRTLHRELAGAKNAASRQELHLLWSPIQALEGHSRLSRSRVNERTGRRLRERVVTRRPSPRRLKTSRDIDGDVGVERGWMGSVLAANGVSATASTATWINHAL